MKSPAGKLAQTNGQTPRGQKRKSVVLNTPGQKLNTPAKAANTPHKGMTPQQKKKSPSPKKPIVEEEEEEEEEQVVDVKAEQSDDEQAEDASDVENEEGEEEDDDDDDDDDAEDDDDDEDDESDAEEEETKKVKVEAPALKKQRIEDNDTVIMIKNCLAVTSRRDISEHFAKYGAITAMWSKFQSILAPFNPNSKPEKGKRLATMRSRIAIFYIRYQSRDQAEKAAEGENSKVFQGRHLSVELLVNSTKIDQAYDVNMTIYVGNISSCVEEEDLWMLFRDFGEIVNVRLLKNFDSRFYKQYAFVTFKTQKSFDAALKLKGQILGGYEIRITKYGAEHTKKNKGNEFIPSQKKQGSPVKKSGPPTKKGKPAQKGKGKAK